MPLNLRTRGVSRRFVAGSRHAYFWPRTSAVPVTAQADAPAVVRSMVSLQVVAFWASTVAVVARSLSISGRGRCPTIDGVGDDPSAPGHVSQQKCFVDAISLDVFECPVVASDGNTYSWSGLKQWCAGASRGPCRSPVDTNGPNLSETVFPNRDLADIMSQWQASIYPALLRGEIPEAIQKWRSPPVLMVDLHGRSLKTGTEPRAPNRHLYPNRALSCIVQRAEAIAEQNNRLDPKSLRVMMWALIASGIVIAVLFVAVAVCVLRRRLASRPPKYADLVSNQPPSYQDLVPEHVPEVVQEQADGAVRPASSEVAHQDRRRSV
ncbi:unnamed protein product (mitochondrion) [Plasmodiophora brassicae]|uniref:U-box domain-containing protein n=1 Tax=Plasmodiophora brassicae TaxID=37360 RepID=A0A0G4INY2_PLABS|nr:hypothetical protein PBRA_005565 [Plasmodiophora brassicae]SPR01913.1 unnamed protein product [Plasmodiophora brassicae]